MRNLTLLTDLYQLTMMQGFYKAGMHEKEAYYDLFFRSNPFGSGYSIAAGLEQALDYIHNIKFNAEDIDYLKTIGVFEDCFLDYLKGFKFTGEIWAIKEGTVVFPNEPLMRIRASRIEAQFIETTLLTIINHQCLIATKASRVAWAAGGDSISDFGLRRAQGPDAGIYGSRAAYIGGCDSTSNVLAGKMFGIPVMGTHAHSWVMSFKDEYTAFKEFITIYPNLCTLLVDTYDTINSGVPKAIKVFDEMGSGLPARYGIRLDSGDLAYLSKAARKMLDEAGHKNAFITASSDLDEHFISNLKQQGAEIDIWGVGTRLITAYDCPSFGGIYKLCAVLEDDEITPKIKISENPVKVTNPGVKKIYRIFDKSTNKLKADLLTLENEIIDQNEDITIFDPHATWKRMTLKKGQYGVMELLEPVYSNGKIAAQMPSCSFIRDYCGKQLSMLWDEYRRLINPHIYPVDLSDKLLTLKNKMISDIRNQAEQ